MAALDNDVAMLDVRCWRPALHATSSVGRLTSRSPAVRWPMSIGRCSAGAEPRRWRVLLAFDPGLARVDEGVGSPLWWARRQGCEGTIAPGDRRQLGQIWPRKRP